MSDEYRLLFSCLDSLSRSVLSTRDGTVVIDSLNIKERRRKQGKYRASRDSWPWRTVRAVGIILRLLYSVRFVIHARTDKIIGLTQHDTNRPHFNSQPLRAPACRDHSRWRHGWAGKQHPRSSCMARGHEPSQLKQNDTRHYRKWTCRLRNMQRLRRGGCRTAPK